jgi:crossover junction endodeoxyribonuclease RuvC
MTTIRIVGLDVSLTSTGVAQLGYTDGLWTHHLYRIRTGPHRKGDYVALWERMRHIRAECGTAVDGVDLVVMEGPSFASVGAASKDLVGLWWVVYDRLARGGHDVVVVPPSTLKRWATGKGNADKAAVGVAIGRIWPDVDLPGNDVVDALGLASIGAQVYGLDVPWAITQYRDLAGVYRSTSREAA